MKILSHRGAWTSVEEKNTEAAFLHSFSAGFGTETDVRDCAGKLVIAHDIANGTEMDLPTFLDHLSAFPTSSALTIALNIKADGLASTLKETLARYPDLDCFVFDMSVPDMRSYYNTGIPVFTRMSEVEQQPVWLELADGVWLDGFESDWFDMQTVEHLIALGKRVCVVSPELHRREHKAMWEKLLTIKHHENLMLCTDHPMLAAEFFK